MIGYSEVLQTLGAMVIFSFILLNANRLVQRNTVFQVDAELEQEVVALAQDIIEESRTKEFDANSTGDLPPVNIPGDFTDPNGLGPAGTTSEDERHEFNDFDDFHKWSDTITTKQGDFDVSCEVYYVDEPDFSTKENYRTTYKKIEITITSSYLTTNDGQRQSYVFDYIRNYYAD
ncbi:MAG: hypothetical protein U5J95_05610 [Balneolaceae bacterium]|nr:hypothetical protein [Balneolaceae bacterium]